MTSARSSCRRSSAPSTSRAIRPSSAACPASSTARARRADRWRDPLPARRRLHRHVAPDVRLLHLAGVQRDRLRRLRGRLPPGARVPLPGRGGGRHRRLRGPARPRRARTSASSWPATRAAAGSPTACCSPACEHLETIRPAGLILFSPEVDLRLDEPSVTENAHLDILPWNIPTASYLHGEDAASASVSPLNADLVGFPPTFVGWGGDEMFRDPIRRYAERLARRRRAHPRPRVRGHVPRLPDPHALDRPEPRVVRPPRGLRAEAGGRRPGLRCRPSCATSRRRARLAAADLDVLPVPVVPEAHNWNPPFRFC